MKYYLRKYGKVWGIFFIREIKCLFFLKVKHVTEYTKSKSKKILCIIIIYHTMTVFIIKIAL